MKLAWIASLAIALALWAAAAGAQVSSSSSAATANPALLEAARSAAGGSVGGPSLPSGAQSLPGAVDPTQYVLGPGDVLVLAIWGRMTRTEMIEVGPEGTVLVPDAGVLRVSGHTLAEGREMILERVRREVRGVEIDVRLARTRRFFVYLTGQVKKPGAADANGASRVTDVLAPDELLDNASRRRVEVLRRDGTKEVADLDLFFLTGDPALNPILRDGDVLQVPVASEFIFAAGAVARPGRYELGPRDSLRTLLRIAGDPLPSAAEDGVLLIRWPEPFRPESLWVRLSEVYSGERNPPLRDGERLYVFFVPQYHEQREATILGEVARPGAFPIVEGRTRLSDLVNAAGGFLPSADLSAVRLRRAVPGAGEKDPELDRLLRLSRNDLTASEYEQLRTKLAGLREDYRVNWETVKFQGESADLLLRNGDLVRVERLVSSIRIDGEVRRPAILEYKPGRRIEDYVQQAGGFTDRAWRGKVRVTRAVTGQTLLARNVSSLDPGDFVWVPEKPDVTVWQQTREVLTAVAQVATIVIAIRSVRN